MLNENVRDMSAEQGNTDNESEAPLPPPPPPSLPQQRTAQPPPQTAPLPLLKNMSDSSVSIKTTARRSPAPSAAAPVVAASSANSRSSPSDSLDSSSNNNNNSVQRHQELPLVHCYSCGEAKQLDISICRVYIRPSYEQMRVGVPFYPTVLDHPKAEKSHVLQSSITFLCIKCLPGFPQQWHQLQENFLKQYTYPNILPRIPLPETVSCYLCSEVIDTKFNTNLVSLTGSAPAERLNAYLKTQPMRKCATPLSFGFTYLCTGCVVPVKRECEE